MCKLQLERQNETDITIWTVVAFRAKLPIRAKDKSLRKTVEMKKNTSAVGEIADSYLDDLIQLDPVSATYFGIGEPNHEFGDYSPDGNQARYELDKSTLAQVTNLEAIQADDQVASRAMEERLSVFCDSFLAGEYRRALNIIHSPLQEIRQVFDMMPQNSEDDFWQIALRLSNVNQALGQYRQSLELGTTLGQMASARQAIGCARQARAYGDPSGFFGQLALSYHGSNEKLRAELDKGAAQAGSAYLELSRYLADDYAPASNESDFVGPERWALHCRIFNGIAVDAKATYEWGWEELARIEDEMRITAEQISPGNSVAEVMASLDHMEGYLIEGEQNFRSWNQDFLDRTMDSLSGVHFHIPEKVRHLEAMIAPPGGAAAMYYTPPSQDFSRPGRTWYPTLGRTTFALWSEVSTAYHEGVPGHHMQFAQILNLGQRLNAFQRLLGTVSGYLEGWALYAERLMDELGFLSDPIYRLGMLAAQAMRAARVVVDIGLHHEFAIPPGHSFLPASTWTPKLAVDLIHSTSGREMAFSKSEVDRYLGWPAQATSYKIGERIWLETRASAKAKLKSEFSLREFHQRGFELGFVGLSQLQMELG